MSDWVKVADKLPKEGKIVEIKAAGDAITRTALFSDGRFWKKRLGPNAGHVWNPMEWRYPEKAAKAKEQSSGGAKEREDQAADHPEG